MNLIDYIDFTVKTLFERFPNISECSLFIDECSDTYFIHVNDSKLLSSEAFCVFDTEITLGFYDLSFQGALSFISDHSIFPEEQFEKRSNPFISFNIEDIYLKTNSFRLDQTTPYPFVFSPLFEFAHDISVNTEIKYKLAA